MSGIISSYGKGYDKGLVAGLTGGRVSGGKKEENSFMEEIAKKKEEILDKVKRGETEVSIPMGSGSFTPSQWDKLIKNVDGAIDDMQARIEEAEEAVEKQAEEKKEKEITEQMLEELLNAELQ